MYNKQAVLLVNEFQNWFENFKIEAKNDYKNTKR